MKHDALQTWTKKLAQLETDYAICSNSEQKFELEIQIERAKSKVAELHQIDKTSANPNSYLLEHIQDERRGNRRLMLAILFVSMVMIIGQLLPNYCTKHFAKIVVDPESTRNSSYTDNVPNYDSTSSRGNHNALEDFLEIYEKLRDEVKSLKVDLAKLQQEKDALSRDKALLREKKISENNDDPRHYGNNPAEVKEQVRQLIDELLIKTEKYSLAQETLQSNQKEFEKIERVIKTLEDYNAKLKSQIDKLSHPVSPPVAPLDTGFPQSKPLP